MARSRPPSPLPRREFLRGAGACAGLWALPGWNVAGLFSRPKSVAIVGAGVAGLSAARALSRLGIDTVVLEALDRIGGRVHTAALGELRIDRGASWVHGMSPKNPLVELFRRLGVRLVPDHVPFHLFEEGNGFLPKWEVKALNKSVTAFIDALPALRAQLGPAADVGGGIERFLTLRGLSGTTRSRVRFMLNAFFEAWYAAPTRRLSLEWIWEDGSFPGLDGFPEGGYGQLITALAEGVDVRTGSPVQSIHYGPSGVRLETSHETLRATHAIVTVPLGVLKQGAIHFDPPLPQAKQAALDRLEMGSFEKVHLLFDHPLGGQMDELFYRPRAGGRLFLKDLWPFSGAPAVLALAGGEFALRMASQSDAEVLRETAEMVQRVTSSGPPSIHALPPVRGDVTRWRDARFFGGSFSYLPPGASPADQQALAAPHQRLHFAGEATHDRYYASVHGALLSGLREAGRIFGRDLDVHDLI